MPAGRSGGHFWSKPSRRMVCYCDHLLLSTLCSGVLIRTKTSQNPRATHAEKPPRAAITSEALDLSRKFADHDVDCRRQDWEKEATDFMAQYTAIREAPRTAEAIFTKVSSPDDVTGQNSLEGPLDIVRFYQTTIKPLVRLFSGHFVAQLHSALADSRKIDSTTSAASPRAFESGNGTETPPHVDHELSPTERCRIIRALCRLQVWFNLFGAGAGGPDGVNRQLCLIPSQKVQFIFCEAFEPVSDFLPYADLLSSFGVRRLRTYSVGCVRGHLMWTFSFGRV